MNNMKKIFNHNTLATIGGLVIAIASAWITIDWSNFNIHNEWPKLGLSAIIAIGGYFTQLKTKAK